MGTVATSTETVFDGETRVRWLGAESMALVLSKEEFLAIDEIDDRYRYELLHGVVVVSPYPGPGERGPNGVLEHWLWSYHEASPGLSKLDGTLSEQAIDTGACIRRADRVIWTGLGRQPALIKDVPSSSSPTPIATGGATTTTSGASTLRSVSKNTGSSTASGEP